MSHNVWHTIANPGSIFDSKAKKRRDRRRDASNGRSGSGGVPFRSDDHPTRKRKRRGGRSGSGGVPFRADSHPTRKRKKRSKSKYKYNKHNTFNMFRGVAKAAKKKQRQAAAHHSAVGHKKHHPKKGHPKKGHPKKGRGMVYRGGGKYHGPKRSQAGNIVDRDINRQVREFVTEAKQRRRQGEYDVNKLDALYDRTKGDLNYVFGETNDFIGAKNQAIDSRFGQTRGDLAQLYSGLQGQQQGNIDNNRNAILQEQAKLKLAQSGMGTPGIDRFNADAAFAQNAAAQNQTNALANLDTMQNMSNSAGSMLQGMSQAALASAVGRAGNTRLEGIQDVRQDTRGQLDEILDEVRKVRANRPAAVNELWNQMDQNAFNRFQDTNQADFNNQLAANQFNLDVAGLNSKNRQFAATMKRDYAKAKAKEAERKRKQKAAAAKKTRQNIQRQGANLSNQLTSAIMPWF